MLSIVLTGKRKHDWLEIAMECKYFQRKESHKILPHVTWEMFPDLQAGQEVIKLRINSLKAF